MRVLRNYGLSVVLSILFIGSWLLQSLTGWVEFAAMQEAHGASAQLFGPSGIRQQAPRNALIWSGVVGGALLLNVLVLLAVAR